MTAADFADVANPTADEIRRWARSRSPQPMQDWGLIISISDAHDLLLIELSTTAVGPKARFFLGMLYLIVGDAVRTQWKTRSKDSMLSLIGLGATSSHLPVKRWAERAHALVENPGVFQYGLWCGGGYARHT